MNKIPVKVEIKVGYTADTAMVTRWYKENGTMVVAGEPLCEVDLEKAVVEINSPATGTLEIVFAAEEIIETENKSFVVAYIVTEGVS